MSMGLVLGRGELAESLLEIAGNTSGDAMDFAEEQFLLFFDTGQRISVQGHKALSEYYFYLADEWRLVMEGKSGAISSETVQ